MPEDKTDLTDAEFETLTDAFVASRRAELDTEDDAPILRAVERIITDRIAPLVALHPKIEHPRHGCCAHPKLCNDHPPECGSRSHGMNRPGWPCADLRALGIRPGSEAGQ